MIDILCESLLYFTEYFLILLMRFIIIVTILITFIAILYTLLVYCVLIKIKFFRELLKEFGLPIPIEYTVVDKNK